jgi:ABC-type transport system involved in cytochrome c biogenesis ATPase subunit
VSEPAVVVRDLRFSYNRSKRVILDGIDLEIPAGTRCLVIGANGAGKTTMLRVIAGKHMVSRETVRVLGASAFHDTWLAGDVEMLGGNWPFDIDLEVDEMLRNAVGIDPERRDHLVELLGVDRTWHMHAVSDGQRRRVQLLFGLMRPRKLLLLDEVPARTCSRSCGRRAKSAAPPSSTPPTSSTPWTSGRPTSCIWSPARCDCSAHCRRSPSWRSGGRRPPPPSFTSSRRGCAGIPVPRYNSGRERRSGWPRNATAEP